MKKLMKQKGFTLVELLVALPIGTAILLVIVASLFQIEQGRVEITGKSAAMMDIDNAAHWLTRDLVLAQATDLTPGADPVPAMFMAWSDLTHWAGDNGTILHSANYSLSGTRLLRTYDGETTIIGRYITDIGFSIDGKLFTITLTSRPGRLPESAITRTVSIRMRSELD